MTPDRVLGDSELTVHQRGIGFPLRRAWGSSMAAGTSPTLLLSQSAAWQPPVIEGPTIVCNGSTYYLCYQVTYRLPSLPSLILMVRRFDAAGPCSTAPVAALNREPWHGHTITFCGLE